MAQTLMNEEGRASFADGAEVALSRGEELQLAIGDDRTTVDAETSGLILSLLRARLAGHAVIVEPLPEELTTGQAADLLGVTRPTVAAMVDRGELVARRIGTHRRVSTADVLRLRGAAGATRATLDEMTRLSVDAGLYD